MAISKLPTIADYWRVDNLIANGGIQNKMIRNHFCKILQNLHFADNREVLSNDSEQNIDEHIMKFKGTSGMKQYIKSKPIKWGFKFWFRCLRKSGYP